MICFQRFARNTRQLRANKRSKDYPVAQSLEVKTKTQNNVRLEQLATQERELRSNQVIFKVAGTRDTKTEAIVGDLEAKYTVSFLVSLKMLSQSKFAGHQEWIDRY